MTQFCSLLEVMIIAVTSSQWCILYQLRGLYIARQLSFAGVNFSVHEVPLSQKFKQMYDSSVAFVSRKSPPF